jgi:hypothetical protein
VLFSHGLTYGDAAARARMPGAAAVNGVATLEEEL